MRIEAAGPHERRLWWRWFWRGVFATIDATGSWIARWSSATDPPPSPFEQLVQRYGGRIYAYLWRMVANPEAASDLCQETFERAWRHFEDLVDSAHQQAWLYRVATNLALNHLRHERAIAHPATPLDASLADDVDLETQVVERDSVRQTLRQLPSRQRIALILHEIHGLSGEEVAQALGISYEAAKMTIWRARERFRALYQREGES
jgi:RNA polymerase sigma-70 factor (ECF subfamily)